MDWQSVGKTAETVLGNVGNVRRIRIIIVMCSIVLARQCFITDWLKETNDFNHFYFHFVYAQLKMKLWS